MFNLSNNVESHCVKVFSGHDDWVRTMHIILRSTQLSAGPLHPNRLTMVDCLLAVLMITYVTISFRTYPPNHLGRLLEYGTRNLVKRN